MKIRPPAVAGHFYPGDKDSLESLMGQLLVPQAKIKNAFAVIAPHAGYVYSGHTAAKTYSSVDIPDTVILMSPNHTGLGHAISLHPAETWITPLGPIQVDLDTLNKIKKRIPEAELDASAQLREHALEVHLPFIQTINPNVRIVPITLSMLNFEQIHKLGTVLSEIILEMEKRDGVRPLIVASSDMTHFEDASTAEKKDKMAIDKIKQLDTKGFINVVEKEDISLCGIYPISVTMEAILHYSKFTKLTPKIELVDYTNSGKVTGDMSSVVAYAGMVMIVS
jgi:AmmeMemoRadiSam system protein B